MTAIDAGAVLGALADPTRREILGRIATGVATTATELARDLPISRQAVGKHLAALREAHLVRRRALGRESHYDLDVEATAAARAWLESVESSWDRRLDRLADLAEAEAGTADAPPAT